VELHRPNHANEPAMLLCQSVFDIVADVAFAVLMLDIWADDFSTYCTINRARKVHFLSGMKRNTFFIVNTGYQYVIVVKN
jgi:hypothetical protein